MWKCSDVLSLHGTLCKTWVYSVEKPRQRSLIIILKQWIELGSGFSPPTPPLVLDWTGLRWF